MSAMTRRVRGLRRWVAWGATIALALVLAGDGGRAATVSTIYGQDPLEVLELKVRPNVIIVLDSSGSMKWGTTAPSGPSNNFYPPQAGDHPRSKTYQAKQVLKQIVSDNKDKVSFMFGQYTQSSVIVMGNRNAATSTAANLAGSMANRFVYTTDSSASPSMLTTQLTVQNDVGGSGDRGLQSWQLIYPAWNTLYYREFIGATTHACTATISAAAAAPKFYRSGGPSTTAGTLAADLKAAMDNAACTPARPTAGRNVYGVAYNGTNGVFTISRASGSNNFEIRWAQTPNNIRGALAAPTSNTGAGTSFVTGTPYTLLYRPNAAAGNTRTYNTGASTWLSQNFTFSETSGASTLTSWNLIAGRFFNGETLDVIASGASAGQICNMTFPTAAERTNPPTLTVRGVTNCGAAPTSTVRFTWGGASYDGNNSIGCNGFQSRVSLIPCDLAMPPALTQVETIHPWLDNEFPLDANGMPHPAPRDLSLPAPATTTGYTERQDGTWAVNTFPPYWAGGIKAMGPTPVANSIRDVDTAFTNLWNSGQAAGSPTPPYPLDPIRNHKNPKEKTILLFVTDGADTCAGSGDGAALTAADYAKNLYIPVEGGCKDTNDPGDTMTGTPLCDDADADGIEGFAEPSASVQTFMIGYGDSVNTPADVNRLNWMAWGGSGLYTNFAGSNSGVNATTDTNLRVLRDRCKTCQDAYIATDAATLAQVLQGIINQGAQDGDFVAAQSITENVFEYVDRASDASNTYDARSPSTRYRAITPTRFITSFSLPGFRGQLKAYQNDGADNALLKWSAGDKLNSLVRGGFTAATCPAGNGAAAGQCMFRLLHGGIGSNGSAGAIKRRIYSTDRNGLFTYDAQTLMDGTANGRLSLWPPGSSAIAPADYTTQGSLDVALGLPSNASASPATDYTALQTRFGACTGTSLPAACSSATALTRMQAARREAREIVLAFLAGATPVRTAGGLARTGTSGSSADRNQILYTYRPWVLADSEIATAAVVTPPLSSEPEATPYLPEYKLFRDGARNSDGKNPDSAGAQIQKGFGLRGPDDDQTTARGANDSRTALKPVMTVVYAPTNLMLHAFRAGPSVSPSDTCTVADATAMNASRDCGGEELWGFLPYDQLGTASEFAAKQPQGRDNHVYMLARGVRFSDVFVPKAMTNVNVGGVTQAAMQGVWRRVLYFGRGIGGKYVTALDVTAPGAYTSTRLQTLGPIPLWNRGNPDTQDGLGGGTANGNATDTTAYARMGQTWSVPVVAYVGTQPFYAAARRSGRAGCAPGGAPGCRVDHVLFMGSGYGDNANEGTTFYTLDALTGDVVSSVDVETAASSYGLNRSPQPTDQNGVAYRNALVANPAGFNPKAFSPLTSVHPAAAEVTRVYIGDVYGRLWKFLAAQPNVAIPVADLGVGQPVGSAVSLLGLPPRPDNPLAYVFVTSGADRRQDGPFRMFGFWDKGDDVTTATAGTSTTCVDSTAPCEAGVTAFSPSEMVFNRIYDQGEPEANCGYTAEAVFRGTAQPTTGFECGSIVTDPATGSQKCVDILGRVFFAGTRLSLPNTKYAPPTPLACGTGQYPCRSQFDSILYALGAKTGNAAYDLNAAGDDAYRVFRDSRITAIQMQADPDPVSGGTTFVADEGQIKGTPAPPPPPGVPPTANTSTANVVMTREPGQPPPAVRYGSTVCQ